MKHIILIVLTIISINCFAINQRLIDGADAYEIAIKNLKEIEIHMASISDSPEYWAKKLEEANNNRFESDGMRKIYQDHIAESNKQIQVLNIQYNEAKDIVKKYEPIKKEYDKQVAWEDKIDDIKMTVLSIVGILMLLSIFALIFWGIVRQHKKYRQLLKDGKITQEEYDRMTRGHSSSTFGDSGINPATGLPMTGIGISDVGGNIRGSSFSSSSSMSSASQDYRDRHRWD